jgi:hypothetical protein
MGQRCPADILESEELDRSAHRRRRPLEDLLRRPRLLEDLAQRRRRPLEDLLRRPRLLEDLAQPRRQSLEVDDGLSGELGMPRRVS